MNEVTDEWFESHLMDGCHIVDTPSTTSVSHSKNNKKEHTKKNDIESPMSDRKPPPEGINEVDFEDYDDDGYFTGDDLPVDEMNEVTDKWFESHLMDDCPIVDTPSTVSVRHSKKDKKEHTKKNDIEIPMSDRKPPPEGIVQMASTNDKDVPPVPKLPAFQDTKVNVGSGVFGYKDNNMSTTKTKEDDNNVVAEINKGEKEMSTTETKEHDNNVVETNKDDEDNVLDVEVIPPGMFKDLQKKYSLSVADGWNYLAKVNPQNTYMLCYLNCPLCSPDSQYSILVGNDKFIRRFAYGQEEYKYEFICGFIALVQHTCHTNIPTYRLPGVSVTMVRTPHPRAQVTASEVIELDGMTYLVSVACASRHFAVLFYDIERQCVIVYDGLFYKLTTWQHHIIHTLKKYGLKRHNAKCNVVVKTKPPGIELCFDDKYAPWCVYNDPIIRQVDGYNCGPIACLKVMEIYGILPPDSIAEIAHQRYGYRGVVMDHYSRFLAQHDRDIKLILNKSGFERFSRDCSVRKNELSGGVDNDKAQIADKESDDEAQVSDKAADDKGKEEGKEADNNSHTSNKRKLAMEKKNTKQQEGAKMAMKQCGDAALKAGISPGAVVTLQVDYRTCYNPEGLVAIVYDVNPRTGGIRVCCEHGVITHDGSKGNYWLPRDKYEVKAPVGTYLPLPDDLAQVRKMVEDGVFIMEMEATMPRISYSQMHQLQINANSPIKKSKGCGCKKGKCGKNCGCKKKNISCHSGCTCTGNCEN